MAEEEIKDVEKLNPEQRIKKLREIAKSSEEEIKKAKYIIK